MWSRILPDFIFVHFQSPITAHRDLTVIQLQVSTLFLMDVTALKTRTEKTSQYINYCTAVRTCVLPIQHSLLQKIGGFYGGIWTALSSSITLDKTSLH